MAFQLRRSAVARGALTAEAAQALPDSEALLLCCLPGVSTAGQVTDVSGRGVGMDVVKTNLDKLGGKVEIESIPGEGTHFIASSESRSTSNSRGVSSIGFPALVASCFSKSSATSVLRRRKK